MTRSNAAKEITGACLSLVFVMSSLGCASAGPSKAESFETDTKAQADSYLTKSREDGRSYIDCVENYATSNAGGDATASEVADAAASICASKLSAYKSNLDTAMTLSAIVNSKFDSRTQNYLMAQAHIDSKAAAQSLVTSTKGRAIDSIIKERARLAEIAAQKIADEKTATDAATAAVKPKTGKKSK